MVSKNNPNKDLNMKLKDIWQSYRAKRMNNSKPEGLIIPLSQGPVTVSAQRAFDAELDKFEEAEQKNVCKGVSIPESQAPAHVSARRAFDKELNKFRNVEAGETLIVPEQSGPRDATIQCAIESECANLDDNSEKPKSWGEHKTNTLQEVLENIIVGSPGSSSEKGESGEEDETESSSESDDSEEEIPSASTPYKSNEEEIPSATTPKMSNTRKKSVPSSSASDSLADSEYIPSTSVEPCSTSDIITTQEGIDTFSTESEADETSNDDFDVPINQIRKRARTSGEQLHVRMKAGNSPVPKVNRKGANQISNRPTKIAASSPTETIKARKKLQLPTETTKTYPRKPTTRSQTMQKGTSKDKQIIGGKKIERKRKRVDGKQPAKEGGATNKVARKQTSKEPPSEELVSRKRKRNEGKPTDIQEAECTKEGASTTTFRSNLKPLVELFAAMKDREEFTDDIVSTLSKTPFSGIFNALLSYDLSAGEVRKPQKAIRTILTCYHKEKKAFCFGGHYIPLQAEDVALVFGLPMSGKMVTLQTKETKAMIYTFSEFYTRNFVRPKTSYVKKAEILYALAVCIGRNDEHKAEDVTKLLIMYLITTVFYPGGFYMFQLSVLPHIDDFETMKSISWAKVFHKKLMSEIEAWTPANPFSISSCSIMIVYFFLEHVHGFLQFSQNRNDEFPRFARWENISLLKLPTNLKTNRKLKVTISIQAENEREECLLEHVDDLVEEPLEETPTLTFEAALLELKMARNRISSLEAENMVLRNQIETLKLGREDEQEWVADRPITTPYPLQNDNIDSRNVAGSTEMTTPNRDVSNAPIDKVSVQKDKTNRTRSYVKKLKARKGHRKPKRISGYIYEEDKKKAQKPKEKKTAEMIDIENLVDEMTETKKPLPPITESPYWTDFADDEKKKVEEFFKNEFTSSKAYYNLKTGIFVTGDVLRCLMFDCFVNGMVMEWFEEDNGNLLNFSPKLEAVYFSPFLWTYIRNHATKAIQVTLSQKLKGINLQNRNVFFFPLNSSKTRHKDDHAGYHWTLLVFDVKSFTFTHYNSMRGRNDKDKYYEDATKLKREVVQALKSVYKLTSKQHEKLQRDVTVGACPQQSDKPNCAIYVLKFMEDILMEKNLEVATAYQEQVDRMKTRICHAVLNHGEYSWNFGPSLPE